MGEGIEFDYAAKFGKSEDEKSFTPVVHILEWKAKNGKERNIS